MEPQLKVTVMSYRSPPTLLKGKRSIPFLGITEQTSNGGGTVCFYLPPSTRIPEARKTPQHRTEMIKIRALCQLSWVGMDGTGVSRCNQPHQMALSKCPNSGLKSALVPFTGPEDGLRMSPGTLCKES